MSLSSIVGHGAGVSGYMRTWLDCTRADGYRGLNAVDFASSYCRD
jgi:hypothetical protein